MPAMVPPLPPSPPHTGEAVQIAGAGASRIDDLRARMGAILAKHARREEPAWKRSEQELGDLPFTSEETEHGTLYRRVLRVGVAQRVGHAPVDYARRADMPWLAALSLEPALAQCNPEDALYVDTETTGLSGGTGTVAFLVGLAFFDRGQLVMEQLFVRTLGEEAAMLHHYVKRVEAASFVVTFNGKSFDLPLLRTRLMLSRVPAAPHRPHLDLLHVARRVHGRKKAVVDPFAQYGEVASGLRLVALECDVLGFVRHDDTPSGEVSQCYLHFLRTGDVRGLFGVVEHNAWDVMTMAAMVGFYGETPSGEQGASLGGPELARVAGVLRRTRQLDLAREIAEHAVAREVSLETLAARGEVARARGDRAAAFEDLSRAILSERPIEREGEQREEPIARRAREVRLALSKLYEHYKKDPAAALAHAEQGTSERPDAHEKRVRRLRERVENPPLSTARPKVSKRKKARAETLNSE